VFPDATATLDSLAVAFAPLVARPRDGAVLLLGPPGLPHTHWTRPNHAAADADAASGGVAFVGGGDVGPRGGRGAGGTDGGGAHGGGGHGGDGNSGNDGGVSSDVHASAAVALLRVLACPTEGRLAPFLNAGTPVFWVGCGSGGGAMLQVGGA
jgi:hypothetical protein